MIKKFTEMRRGSAGADAAGNVGTQQCTVGKSTNSGPHPTYEEKQKCTSRKQELTIRNARQRSRAHSQLPSRIRQDRASRKLSSTPSRRGCIGLGYGDLCLSSCGVCCIRRLARRIWPSNKCMLAQGAEVNRG